MRPVSSGVFDLRKRQLQRAQAYLKVLLVISLAEGAEEHKFQAIASSMATRLLDKLDENEVKLAKLLEALTKYWSHRACSNTVVQSVHLMCFESLGAVL